MTGSFSHIFTDLIAFYGIELRASIAEKIGILWKLTSIFLSPPCWKVLVYMNPRGYRPGGVATRWLPPRPPIWLARVGHTPGAMLPAGPINGMVTSCIRQKHHTCFSVSRHFLTRPISGIKIDVRMHASPKSPSTFTFTGYGRLMANGDYWGLMGIYLASINL